MKPVYYLYVLYFAILCSCKNDDGQEIVANMQRNIDKMGHLWRISEIVYSYEGYEDSVVVDIGNIYFEPCRLGDQTMECPGYHQVDGCPQVAFSYSVGQILDDFVFRTGEYVDNCFDISPGNTNIEKITDDSLVFVTSTGKESFRELGKGEEGEYGILTKVTLTREPN